MKKLLIITLLAIGSIFSSNAQTVFLENFETTTTSMPTGWHQQVPNSDPTNLGWQFDTAYLPLNGGLGTYYFTTDGSYFAFVNDLDNNGSRSCNSDTLYSASFSTIGYSHLFISLDALYWDFYESASILASNDGGHTWKWISNIPGNINSWGHYTFNFDAFANKPNIMIALTYDDNCVQGAGLAVDNIQVYVPANILDMSVTSQITNIFVQTNAPTIIQGTIFNYGGDSIAQMHLNYSIDGGPAVTDAVTSLSIEPLTSYNFTHSIPWVPSVAGYHTVKIWADRLNGGNDQNHANDTLTTTVMAVDSILPKQVAFEEFMQASCSPCLWATPNLDAILRRCIAEGICNPIRYHVDWPGVDYMNNETDNQFVNQMVGFYNIGGVPDAMVDGTASYDPAYMNASEIETEATKGSPIKIDITSANYASTSNEYSATVRITSYTPLPAGLIVRAVLTVDTIKYDTDQSSEDPKYGFKPPIGTFASNGDPDTLYPYLLNFPNVAEDIMPSDTGAILSAFVISTQTQILNLHWIKNHPWGLNPDSLHYDSLFPGEHLTVYVQTPTAIPALGLAANYIYQSASAPFTSQIVTGIRSVNNAVSLKLFPNPTKGNTSLQLNLNEEQNVTIRVYSLLGENLFIEKEGNMVAGSHQIAIPSMNLPSGVYFVKFISDKTSITRKLVIQK